MWFEFNEDEVMELISVLNWHMDCTNSPTDVSRIDDILNSITRQQDNNKLLDKIPPVIIDAVEEEIDEIFDNVYLVEEYLPAGKTLVYTLLIEDKEEDTDEMQSTVEEVQEIADKMCLCLDADTVGEIAVEANRRWHEAEDPLDIIDYIKIILDGYAHDYNTKMFGDSTE